MDLSFGLENHLCIFQEFHQWNILLMVAEVTHRIYETQKWPVGIQSNCHMCPKDETESIHLIYRTIWPLKFKKKLWTIRQSCCSNCHCGKNVLPIRNSIYCTSGYDIWYTLRRPPHTGTGAPAPKCLVSLAERHHSGEDDQEIPCLGRHMGSFVVTEIFGIGDSASIELEKYFSMKSDESTTTILH